MSLAQYASPYNNDDSVETNNINSNIRMTQSQNQNQNRGGGGGGGGIKGEKKMPPSSFRKTIKRPLAQQQQQQQQQQQNLESAQQTQTQSRVANFMSKLNSVKTTNYLQGDDGSNSSETDLADYQPMNSNDESININAHENQNGDNNDDGVVTRENFEKEVLNSTQPVLIDFWAPWCMPCKIIAPAVEKLAEEFKGRVKVSKANVDENPDIATELSVMNIPTLVLFKNGSEVSRIIGVNSKESISAKIEEALI